MSRTPATGGDGGGENLPQWGESKKKDPPKKAPPARRRRWPKIVLGVLIVLVVGAGVLITFAPAIASSIAPGYIEDAAGKEIKGSVKVKDVSLSWGGPMTVGPVELYDDKGKLVGNLEAKLAPGLWTIVSERWWSKKNLDVGQIELAGKLNVVQEGEESNLTRAIEPAQPSKPKPAKSGGGAPFDSIKGSVKVAGLDVTYTDKRAAPGTPMAAGVGVSQFAGDVKFDYDAKKGAAIAKADLAGALKGAGAGTGAGDKIVLTADVNLKRDAKGNIEQIDAKADLLGAPLDLVDGLANFGGELVKSLGSRGDVRVQVNGTLDNATAKLNATAQDASADLEFAYTGGVLKTAKPGVVKVRSTGFIAGMPGLKEKFENLGKNVRLDVPPSVEITLASLSIPVPKAALEGALGGGGAGAAPKLTDLDLRAGTADLTVAIGGQRGVINTEGLGGGAAHPATGRVQVVPRGSAHDPTECPDARRRSRDGGDEGDGGWQARGRTGHRPGADGIAGRPGAPQDGRAPEGGGRSEAHGRDHGAAPADRGRDGDAAGPRQGRRPDAGRRDQADDGGGRGG